MNQDNLMNINSHVVIRTFMLKVNVSRQQTKQTYFDHRKTSIIMRNIATTRLKMIIPTKTMHEFAPVKPNEPS
jgi:hypothetical protein